MEIVDRPGLEEEGPTQRLHRASSLCRFERFVQGILAEMRGEPSATYAGNLFGFPVPVSGSPPPPVSRSLLRGFDVLQDEEHFALADQTELPAGDGLDGQGVVPQPARQLQEVAVLRFEAGDGLLELP